jgi:hypothetical protein
LPPVGNFPMAGATGWRVFALTIVIAPIVALYSLYAQRKLLETLEPLFRQIGGSR